MSCHNSNLNSSIYKDSVIFPLLTNLFALHTSHLTPCNFNISRRKFPITVNCWFCNQNYSVPYDSANSWDCPGCEQYNGFTKDGDYNKEIPSQKIYKLNTSKNSSCSEKSFKYTPAPSNGLCEFCNRNQELKMQQLASFTPSDPDNFDDEVEDYK